MARSRFTLTALAVTALVLVAGACSDSSTPELGAPVASIDPETLAGEFVLDVDPLSAQEARWEETWGEDGLLVALVQDMNELLRLPEDITVKLVSGDDEDGPHYRPEEQTLYMPVGFAQQTADDLAAAGVPQDQIDELVALNAAFVLVHEMGHSLVDVLQLPITAREEDSVDALGVVLMTQGDMAETGPGGEKILSAVPDAAAEVFDALAVDAQYDPEDFWDEHSLAPQRAATIACLTYGSDPEGLDFMRESLQDDRGERCQAEYQQVGNGWLTLLAPYLTEQATGNENG